MTKEMVRLVEVQGWWVAVAGVGDDEAKIRDVDLAEKLGYARPRKIRDLIKRLLEEGKLSDVCERPAVVRWQTPTGGIRVMDVIEYWLTEKQAMKVVTQAETRLADAITNQMIEVYSYARKNALSQSAVDPSLAALQAKTAHLQAVRPLLDSSFQQIEDLEYKGIIDAATASAHRTQLLLTLAGIDLTKAPMIKYESVAPRDTMPLNSPILENVKTPGNLPMTGIGFNGQVDRAGFHYAHDLEKEFGVSADVIGKLARAAGIFMKITTIENEYGFKYNHPHGVEGKTKEAWMYSEKSKDILRELAAQFLASYAGRSVRKTSMTTVAATVGKKWKSEQPLVEPTTAPLNVN